MNNYYFDYCNESANDDAIINRLAKENLDDCFYCKDFETYERNKALIESCEFDNLKRMTHEERNNLYVSLQSKMDECISKGEDWSIYYDCYNNVVEFNDREYYYENIDAFREYASHMNEPDFDWDYYSDWHKDLYGVRP